MTEKVVSFLSRENRATPSVAAPGDTNPSDATMFEHSHNGRQDFDVNIKIAMTKFTKYITISH